MNSILTEHVRIVQQEVSNMARITARISRKHAAMASVVLLGICGAALWAGFSNPCLRGQFTPHEQPPGAVFDLLGDATAAMHGRYAATDDLGQTLDCLDMFEVAPGEYYGVHHHYNGTSFSVHLVRSTDLLVWSFVCVLAHEASMPAIAFQAATGEVYLAHEQWQNPGTNAPCWIAFKYYPTIEHLKNATATMAYQTGRSFSDLEGTPSFYAILDDGNEIRVGFHFNGAGGLDRVATGVLRDFKAGTPTWTAEDWVVYNQQLICMGIQGHIGGRDAGDIWGKQYSIQEAQETRDDWASWRSYLYSWDDGGFWPLAVKTHGNSTSFSNPHFQVIHDPQNFSRLAIFVSYFALGEGAATGESGELFFYKDYSL